MLIRVSWRAHFALTRRCLTRSFAPNYLSCSRRHMEAGYTEWLGSHETPAFEQIIGAPAALGTSSRHVTQLHLYKTMHIWYASDRHMVRIYICDGRSHPLVEGTTAMYIVYSVVCSSLRPLLLFLYYQFEAEITVVAYQQHCVGVQPKRL